MHRVSIYSRFKIQIKVACKDNKKTGRLICKSTYFPPKVVYKIPEINPGGNFFSFPKTKPTFTRNN
jgi:hypothetical protein